MNAKETKNLQKLRIKVESTSLSNPACMMCHIWRLLAPSTLLHNEEVLPAHWAVSSDHYFDITH